MATIRWGTNTAKAFDDNTAWQGGVAPGLTDNALFDGEYNGNCTAPAATVNLSTGHVEVTENYSGTMGASGANLLIDADYLRYHGSGSEAWFEGKFGDIYVNTTQVGSNAFNIKVPSTNTTNMFCARGRVTVLGDANGGSAFNSIVCGQVDQSQQLTLIIEDGTGAISGLRLASGRHTIKRDVSDLTVSGTAVVDVTDTAAANNIVTVLGGVLSWKSSGDITAALRVLGGSFNASGNSQPITIAAGELAHPATVNLDRGPGNTTISSPLTVIGQPKLIISGGAGDFVYV